MARIARPGRSGQARRGVALFLKISTASLIAFAVPSVIYGVLIWMVQPSSTAIIIGFGVVWLMGFRTLLRMLIAQIPDIPPWLNS